MDLMQSTAYGSLSGVRFYPEWRPDAAFLADDIGAADSA